MSLWLDPVRQVVMFCNVMPDLFLQYWQIDQINNWQIYFYHDL